ncbi:hypothetical protein [Hymenobacter lucidus]|uniref:Uncharacterized protein n=1 Tax=Hymenobacter lucidus TaxID=2880930 RepID=A0ABS8AMZ3_9BACT|nr:hypothetical protein [Hymenobacter lucidus]MCB2406352.1 hypothetical protein [Hymenobacter lucidus]
MNIIALRILPPIAIGRLGASETPLEAYDLAIAADKPLDFRQIIPRDTLQIDTATGTATEYLPKSIRFKDAASVRAKDGRIRPVAPFLEVFAITDEAPDALVPLTVDMLEQAGCTMQDIHWQVSVGNIKVFRRTGDEQDKIIAELRDIRSHEVQALAGVCGNFIDGKTLPLGTVQFIAPTQEFPQIRLRFVPATGAVYGAALERQKDDTGTMQPDPIIQLEEQILYDKQKGKWLGYSETGTPNPLYTNPAQIFAGYNASNGNRVSWGYLDDECDGFVEFHLQAPGGPLLARAHISAGPPAFAPDTLPVRVVSDELEQILLGPEVDGATIDEAEEIVRRALETVRLMNTAVMNGNPFEGKWNTASTMVRQDTNDFGRLYEPIMAQSIVDNLAVLALHDRIFSGLSTGAAPWFSDVFRRPDQIGDLSDRMRRKMPALMRGADGRALTLTHRQINTVIKAAVSAMFEDQVPAATTAAPAAEAPLKAANLTAQLHYQAKGNPISVLPRTAISNCFPGLEFDFRNLWRRVFQGIVLIENNNYVLETTEEYQHLLHCRLVAVDHKLTTVATSGPVFPGGDNVPLQTADNPNGVSFMEWSNSLADVLQKQGQEVVCHFTKNPSLHEVVANKDDLSNPEKYQQATLTVNHIFMPDSAALSDEIIKPGELTQGLCAPWQNDYRECACYYWAASRPDFVNVQPNERGLSAGDNWMAKKRSGEYIPDDRTDSRLLSYDDLFKNWQGELSFIIQGQDAIETASGSPDSAV